MNNMLAAMQGNLYLAKNRADDKEVMVQKLDNIEKLSVRAADMVKQLLTFARKDRVQMGYFQLNHLIIEASKLAESGIPENIEYSLDVCDETLVVFGDATQLEQVLINLLNNARDAVADVSKATLTCCLDCLAKYDNFSKKYPEYNNMPLAHLSIRDNGCGIEEANLKYVFEPFFTTKGVGEGTGLGLSMVYGAIETHKGLIEVSSDTTGTIFNIYLPTYEESFTSEVNNPLEVIQGLGETILLVDDEEVARETIGEVLSSIGYRILLASDGEDGWEMFQENKDDICLIVTDVVMPRLSGIELAKRIREVDEKMPFIFATGYDLINAIKEEDKINNSMFVKKPFSIESLSQSIRNLIHKH